MMIEVVALATTTTFGLTLMILGLSACISNAAYGFKLVLAGSVIFGFARAWYRKL